jgi:acetoin:2,6-dichlorophenolindophenol oxidoreductase subunit beta
VPIGKAAMRCEGHDVTIVALSFMSLQATRAAALLAENGISAEVIDIRSLKPLDEETILASVRKTGRMVVADGGWLSFGASAEIVARVAEKAFASLRSPVLRVALPDVPAPMSAPLERAYYPMAEAIVKAVDEVVNYCRH